MFILSRAACLPVLVQKYHPSSQNLVVGFNCGSVRSSSWSSDRPPSSRGRLAACPSAGRGYLALPSASAFSCRLKAITFRTSCGKTLRTHIDRQLGSRPCTRPLIDCEQYVMHHSSTLGEYRPVNCQKRARPETMTFWVQTLGRGEDLDGRPICKGVLPNFLLLLLGSLLGRLLVGHGVGGKWKRRRLIENTQKWCSISTASVDLGCTAHVSIQHGHSIGL